MEFTVTEHVIPAQHLRELPDALAVSDIEPNTSVQIHVKQYTPKNHDPQPGDITILAFHANGFCKETYEPVWEALLTALPPGKRLRSIWIADVAHQGSSYLLNENKLGTGIAWDDHARDVLYMVNHFRNEMPPPILGVGHSMGGVVLLKLAMLHPRLLHSVALLDPWLWSARNANPVSPAKTLKPVLFRKDKFTNPDATIEALRRNPVFKNWDNRCLDIYLSHFFRPTPTLLHPTSERATSSSPNSSSTEYTLRTPKQMEFHSLYRPNPDGLNTQPTSTRLERLLMPYVHYDSPLKAPLTNPSSKIAISHLASLRPRCLFLYGSNSHLSAGKHAEADRARNLEITGIESGGSGGKNLGCVSDDEVPGSHLFPFENPDKLGSRLAQWLDEEQRIWVDERKQLENAMWKGREGVKERQSLDPKFVEVIKTWNGEGWSDEKVREKQKEKAKL